MIVHLIEGAAVGASSHVPQMRALASVIDQGSTAKPDSAHIIPAGATDDIWVWDLKGMEVTTPGSSDRADLTWQATSKQDGAEIPTDDVGWGSLARVPDLRVLSGATKIDPTRYSSFVSSVALNHGHLRALQPGGIGSTAVWSCTDGNGVELVRRAFTDAVRYTCPTNGKAMTIRVGSQPIVFKADMTAAVQVTNLPSSMTTCPSPCRPNMNDFSKLAQLVDKKFTPNIKLVRFTPPKGDDVLPDYCPGGRV
jgi:hypothetical protein